MVTSERETAHQTLGKRTFWFAHSAFQEVKHINHILFMRISSWLSDSKIKN